MTEEEEKERSGERADASQRKIILKECDPAKSENKILPDEDKYCLSTSDSNISVITQSHSLVKSYKIRSGTRNNQDGTSRHRNG